MLTYNVLHTYVGMFLWNLTLQSTSPYLTWPNIREKTTHESETLLFRKPLCSSSVSDIMQWPNFLPGPHPGRARVQEMAPRPPTPPLPVSPTTYWPSSSPTRWWTRPCPPWPSARSLSAPPAGSHNLTHIYTHTHTYLVLSPAQQSPACPLPFISRHHHRSCCSCVQVSTAFSVKTDQTSWHAKGSAVVWNHLGMFALSTAVSMTFYPMA